MNRIRNNDMARGLALIVICLAGLWLISGCESDPVAPQDEVPSLDQEDVAWQASVLALALAKVTPQAIQFDARKSDPPLSYSLDDPGLGLFGTVFLDYRMDAEDGPHATPDDGTFVRIYTESGELAVIKTPVGGAVAMTFDLKATIDRDDDTAVFIEGSSGTYETGTYEDGEFTLGHYSATFQLDNLAVDLNQEFPVAGYLIFTSGGHTIVVEFGGNILTVHLESMELTINLTTGEITKT